MRKIYQWVLLFFIGLVSYNELSAQLQSSDQLIYTASADHLKLLRERAAIYNGAEYIGYGQQIKGHPFFGDENLKRGDLLYLGVWYRDIPLYFDLVEGVVIIQSHNADHYLRLPSSKIDAFTYGNDYFVRITPEQGERNQSGFYQQLYNGTIKIYAKQKKVLVVSGSNENRGGVFHQFNQYFVVYENNWNEIKSSNDLIRVFRPFKDQLKRFLAGQPIRFRKNPEGLLVKSAVFIEKLIK